MLPSMLRWRAKYIKTTSQIHAAQANADALDRGISSPHRPCFCQEDHFRCRCALWLSNGRGATPEHLVQALHGA